MAGKTLKELEDEVAELRDAVRDLYSLERSPSPKLNLPTLGVFRGWKPNQFLSNFSLQKSPVLFSRNLVTYMFSENDK